jgi:hypothetical protein
MATNSRQSESNEGAATQTTKNAAGLSKAKKTKKDRLCTLLRRKSGASIATLQRELGWQQHTVRAAISGVRKTGETVECLPGKAGPTYRIVNAAIAE